MWIAQLEELDLERMKPGQEGCGEVGGPCGQPHDSAVLPNDFDCPGSMQQSTTVSTKLQLKDLPAVAR